MTDTIRERIISAFVERASALTSLEVQRVQRFHSESKELAISVWDGADQSQPPLYGQYLNQFPIAMECIWQHGEDNASVSANALIGEVTLTLIGPKVDKTFGGLATSTVRVSATPNYPDDGSDTTSLTVMFQINYTTVTGDPYTVPD